MDPSYVLYGRPGSGSVAVQIALEEIGAPYERVWVGREPEAVAHYRRLNPAGRVPALKLPEGTILAESAAILIHLALVHPQARLAPEPGTPRHGEFLQWMVFLSANLYEACLRIFYSARYSTRGEADAEAIRRQGMADFIEHTSVIAQRLSPYVLGESYSIADSYLYMLVSWYPEPAQLEARLPAIAAHTTRIRARPAVKKVEADNAA
ncbi:MAG TPA: glutathione S-transferase family protein [Steroidobacteraceae bacterium]|nr:glutathione S-transferase family protein [Steroidobacteraceae bacterium]